MVMKMTMTVRLGQSLVNAQGPQNERSSYVKGELGTLGDPHPTGSPPVGRGVDRAHPPPPPPCSSGAAQTQVPEAWAGPTGHLESAGPHPARAREASCVLDLLNYQDEMEI